MILFIQQISLYLLCDSTIRKTWLQVPIFLSSQLESEIASELKWNRNITFSQIVLLKAARISPAIGTKRLKVTYSVSSNSPFVTSGAKFLLTIVYYSFSYDFIVIKSIIAANVFEVSTITNSFQCKIIIILSRLGVPHLAIMCYNFLLISCTKSTFKTLLGQLLLEFSSNHWTARNKAIQILLYGSVA